MLCWVSSVIGCRVVYRALPKVNLNVTLGHLFRTRPFASCGFAPKEKWLEAFRIVRYGLLVHDP